MYLTQSDIANLHLNTNQNITAMQTLLDLVKSDANSEEKRAMQEGVDYYDIKHKILDHDFRIYYLENEAKINHNKSNNHIVHPYHGVLVDQKSDYIAGKEITFNIDNKSFSDEVGKLLGKKFDDMILSLIVQLSNKGKEYIHPYINSFGEFDYLLIDAREVIPIYDSQFQNTLVGIIRYYIVEVKKKVTDQPTYKYKVEVWDHEKTWFFMENENGELELDTDYPNNPKYHFYRTNKFLSSREGIGWGVPPLIEIWNNDNADSDLKYTKMLIDDYDFQVSDMSNKLVNVARLVWILKGYEKSDLAEFMTNLNSFSAIKVRTDGAVDTKSSDIPHDAHNLHLDRLEDNIYIFGRGVNMRSDKFGNSPSGVALKFMYALLDLKANATIRKLHLGLEEFMWFMTQYLRIAKHVNYDYREVQAVFNKSMILNEKELADMAIQAKGILSDETVVANHPLVDDKEKEMERIKKQREEEGYSINDLEEDEDDDQK